MAHATSCRALDISESWFYKWHKRAPTARAERRVLLDAAVAAALRASRDTYRWPRIHDHLIDDGWKVSVNTVAESMARQGAGGRSKKCCKNLTRADKSKQLFPDLLRCDFTAVAPGELRSTSWRTRSPSGVWPVDERRGRKGPTKLTPDVVAVLVGADASVSTAELSAEITRRFGVSLHSRTVERARRR